MPRWLWQLKLKGFHPQLKAYLSFLWRQRPNGCNWSRELRGRYFQRSIRTISYWDRFLLNHHLVWDKDRGQFTHRTGARPYFKKPIWETKRSLAAWEKAHKTAD